MGRLLREQTYRARQLRASATAAEQALWELLRGRRLAGLKFRRQQPLGPYVADFFCEEVALVVEADGPVHAERRDHDVARDRFFASLGVVTLRFSNEEILTRPRGVLRRIVRELRH
jgi:adenine-specific DNA-methyltransferase